MKAVIPTAGLGTRLLPASMVIPKPLMPVPDGAGRVVPAVVSIVGEALDAGAREAGLVVRPDHLPTLRRLFREGPSRELRAALRGRPDDLGILESILEMGRRVTFIPQTRPAGFGDAVLCARDWIGGERFLLLLGDHLYRSSTGISCTAQLLRASTGFEESSVGVVQTPIGETSRYGTVGAEPLPGKRGLFRLLRIVEKPTPSYAREHLVTEGLPEGTALTLFGCYLLEPRIMEILSEGAEGPAATRAELGLTECMERLREERGFYGVTIEGSRTDFGVPEGYFSLFKRDAPREG